MRVILATTGIVESFQEWLDGSGPLSRPACFRLPPPTSLRWRRILSVARTIWWNCKQSHRKFCLEAMKVSRSFSIFGSLSAIFLPRRVTLARNKAAQSSDGANASTATTEWSGQASHISRLGTSKPMILILSVVESIVSVPASVLIRKTFLRKNSLVQRIFASHLPRRPRHARRPFCCPDSPKCSPIFDVRGQEQKGGGAHCLDQRQQARRWRKEVKEGLNRVLLLT